MKPKPKGDYDIGYGKPPAHTRWKQGQSGNPRGRPSERRDIAAAVLRAAGETVQVTVNGRARRISKLEAAATQLANQAVRGDLHAIKYFMTLCAESLPRAEPKQVVYRIEGGLPDRDDPPPELDDGPPNKDGEDPETSAS